MSLVIYVTLNFHDLYSPVLVKIHYDPLCSHLTSPSVISYLLDSEVQQQVVSCTLKSFSHQRLIRQFLGGSQSPASRTPLSRLPYLFVPLSPNSRPLLCFSRYHVNHAVWLPILIGSALALSKIKNCVVNRTTSHSPARSLKRHSFNTSLHHAAKSSVFCELQSTGASSQEGLPWTDFSPPHQKIQRQIKMVFDDILPDSLCCSYGEFRLLARQTKHWHDWHSRWARHMSCHLIHVLWCKRLGKVSNFTGSNAVFFIPSMNFHFLTFLAYKFCFKRRKTLNGSQETLGSFLWLDVSSDK